MYMVGTPGKRLGFVLSISLRMAPMSRGFGYRITSPPFTMERSMTAVSPYTWKRGIAPRTRSGPCAPVTNHAAHWAAFATRFRWVSIAPFGVPVVPPVYCRTATSSGFAGSEDREESHDEVGRVREEEGHAVAGANANQPETGREPVDRGIEVAIRQRLPIECDRGSVAVLSHGPTEQVLHRDIRIGEGPGKVGGPTSKPRPLQRGRLSHRCSIGGAIEREWGPAARGQRLSP